MSIFKKGLSTTIFTLLLMSGSVLAATPDEDAVAKREQEWSRAWVESDYTMLESLHAADYFAINNVGQFTSRAQVLSDVHANKFKYTSMKHENMQIRIYGNTAVVNGLTINKGYRGDRDVSGEFAYTRVYVKENGIWRAVLAQYTRPKG